ncbi:MAG: response regulator [Oleibacter sp.]|nr:response regulator [Thalassolituus sp.]
MPAPHVMIVDDAPENRLVLSTLLESDYQTSEAECGEDAINMLSDARPDLILLDISMPGMSGYDVCVNIRKKPETRGIPVIFVSAKDSTEERLQGFEAGADDFLTKPIDGNSLLEKVKFHIQRSLEKKEAQKQSQDAMKVAMEAMTSSSELGQIIQFVKEVQTIRTAMQLSTSIMTVASQFGLNTAVLIDTAPATLLGCSKDSMEARLMEKFRTAEQRITNMGVRTIIRSGPVVMLIKNMPYDDESRYGRLKDHLAVLADIASDRAKSILAESMMHEQRLSFLKEIIALAELNIEKTSNEIQNFSDVVTQTMSDMLIQLEGMLFNLGLEDDQEKKLLGLANVTTDKLEDTTRDTSRLNNNLNNILEALYDLLHDIQEKEQD